MSSTPIVFPIPIGPFIRLQVELREHVGREEGSDLAAPVVMVEQGIGFKPLNDLLGISNLKVGEVFDQRMHVLRLLIQIEHGIFHAHEVMGHLKCTGSIKNGDEFILAVNGFGMRDGRRPAFIGKVD
jgi:hypothetical protein